MPYVPFDEIRTAFKNLNKYLKEDEFASQYLEMLEFLLETDCVFDFDSPYWQSERKLWHSVFMPKNQNELDLSYFIWCYLNENGRQNNHIEGNDFSKALRCMWNVLENVSRDENFEDRLKKFEVFIEERDASLYGSDTKTDEQFKDGQWKEEIEKARIYAGEFDATSELVDLLHDAECCLHGRIRIGLYNLKNANETYELDVYGLDVIDKNLKWINNLFKQWNSAEEKSEIRKNIILNIMFSESPAPEASMLLSTKDDNLRKLLTTSDDEFLQSTLFTGNGDFAEKIDLRNTTPSISYRKKGSFDRDWRVSLVRLANENVDIWGHAIKKYCYDGGIYAFKGANIKNAIPINDWRIEFWFKGELRNAFLNLPWNDGCNPNWAQNDSKEGMRMNDSNTYSNWVIYQKGKDRLIYFWSDKITLSTDIPGKHEEIFPVSKAENVDVPAFISELIKNIKILMS